MGKHRQRRNLEACVVSSLIQGGDKVREICNEFDINSEHFEDLTLSWLFGNLMAGLSIPTDAYETYAMWVPTADNGRYYIELLYEREPVNHGN